MMKLLWMARSPVNQESFNSARTDTQLQLDVDAPAKEIEEYQVDKQRDTYHRNRRIIVE
jgi:hypothetical protein